MPVDGWERYKDLDHETQRQVKGIVKGRIRGGDFPSISETVGLSAHHVSHYIHILRIPTTNAFRMRRLAKLYCQGLSAPEVAQRMGLTVRAVNVLRGHLRLPPFPRQKHRMKLSVPGHPGLTVRQVAEKLGVSRQTVYNRIPAAQRSIETTP
ncbi:hypothetical protein ASG87_01430 [Frateuria sp. Soil773]|nr:hypothetical protein ASG87_01430 [Frateuria sp. Soil773]